MQFKIAIFVAAMPFIGTALGGCYNGGAKWADIGTPDDINKALEDICDVLADRYYVGEDMSRCIHVNSHGFHFSWRVDVVPINQNYAWIMKDECVDIGRQAISECSNYGGEDLDIWSGPTSDGGEAVEVNVRADPQYKNYEC